eukprot:scaffold2015_cov186-Amphora_coffeaeformis.AAC.13
MSPPLQQQQQQQGDRAKHAAVTSRPDIVPESPLQTTPHVWYPASHQPHYTILLGQTQQQQQESSTSPYMVLARPDNNGSSQQHGTIRLGGSHHYHHQQQTSAAAAAITPLLLLHDDDEDDDDDQLRKILQQSPPNANHIFRPRTSKRARREQRQELSLSSSTINGKTTRNIHNHDSQQHQEPREAYSPWEPVPWPNITAAGHINMDELSERSSAAGTGTRRHHENSTMKRAESPLLVPRFGTPPNVSSSCNNNNNILLPCPPSPLVRRNAKKRPATTPDNKDDDTLAGLLVTPESATALRLEAASSSDDGNSHAHKRAKTTSHSVPPPPPPPTSWPSLLQRFWTYCHEQRPHLLETLISAVGECQELSTIQTDDLDDSRSNKNDNDALSSAVMTVLVREWGGPLLGEVYRQVLAQQPKPDTKFRAFWNEKQKNKTNVGNGDRKRLPTRSEEYKDNGTTRSYKIQYDSSVGASCCTSLLALMFLVAPGNVAAVG